MNRHILDSYIFNISYFDAFPTHKQLNNIVVKCDSLTVVGILHSHEYYIDSYKEMSEESWFFDSEIGFTISEIEIHFIGCEDTVCQLNIMGVDFADVISSRIIFF